MKTISLLTILILGTLDGFSQPDLGGRFELGGGLSYSFSSSKAFGPEITYQSLSIQPNVGYFVTPALEISLGTAITYSRSKYSGGIVFINGIPVPFSDSNQESFHLSVLPGVRYHFLIDDLLVPYLALSAQLSWQRSVSGSYQSPWTKPSIVAPTIDAGVRFFISNDWALRVGLTYSKTLQIAGESDIKEYDIAFGTGFAIFL